MKFRLTNALISGTVFLTLLSAAPSCLAATLGQWTTILDSSNDSIQGNTVGGTDYEIYAAFYKQTSQRVYFAFNTNLPLQGIYNPGANDNHTGPGDIIINASGRSLSAANGSLLGIRFASNNNSMAPAIGVFKDVTVVSVAQENNFRLPSLAAYNAWVQGGGGTPTNGSLPANTTYFNQAATVPNVIASGTQLADIQFMTTNELSELNGIPGAGGLYTYGISFDSSLLPDGQFTFHWAPDCDNDIIAGTVEKVSVPESSNVFGLLALLVGLGMKRLINISWLRRA